MRTFKRSATLITTNVNIDVVERFYNLTKEACLNACIIALQ